MPLGDLRPDPSNPRLPHGIKDELRNDDLLVYLADSFQPFVVAESVARHGYFGSEPLIVYREDGDDCWTVLEGNRRLTALLGLARPDLRARFKDRDAWEGLDPIQQITDETLVPVLIADTREDADPVIGFRHIGGILEWKPLQRAQFIAHLVDERGQQFAEVADTVGDTEDTVRMLYRNQSILVRANELGRPDMLQQGQGRFGTYTAALNRTGLRDFIGAAPVREVHEKAPQLADGRLDDLIELFGWLYGSGDDKKVIRDTRELSILAEVVKREDALSELRRTRDLYSAYALTPAPNKTLARQLAMAAGNLRAAVASVELIVDDPRTRERADEMQDLLRELYTALDSQDAANLEE